MKRNNDNMQLDLDDNEEVDNSNNTSDNDVISDNDFPDDFIFGTGKAAYKHEGAGTQGDKMSMSNRKNVPATPIETEFSNISRKDFPDGFIFGTATSAYQHEGGAMKGGRGLSVWDVFSLKTPDRIIDGSNGNIAVDMYANYKEDIKLMKGIGFDAYRFSISWSRILPGGKLCLGVNQEGIDFYNRIIDTLLANGIKPYVTLFHWDLPYLLEKDYGGFLDEEIVKDFRDFAELCFWEFGDRVKNWITLNEPWTYCVMGYVNCVFPPGNKDPAPATTPSDVKLENLQYVSNDLITQIGNFSSDTKNIVNKSISYRGSKVKNPLMDTLSLFAAYADSDNTDTYSTTADAVNSILDLSGFTVAAPNWYDFITKLVQFLRQNGLLDWICSKPKPVPKSAIRDVYTVSRNLLLAHAEAVQSYRYKFKKHQKGEIGITLVSHWFEPLIENGYSEKTIKDNKDAAKRAIDFMLGWFLEPVLTGQFPESMMKNIPAGNIKPFTPEEMKLLKGSIDFLGLNYYTAQYVINDPHPSTGKGYDGDKKAAFPEDKPIGVVPKDGIFWLQVYPQGIYKLLKYIKETYKENVPAICITENGVAEIDHKRTAYEACADKTRVNYYRDHLGNILKAMNETKNNGEKKVDVKAYFAWSFCDNFEWDQGYGPRFGLIYIDYLNHLKRYPKHSAMWFSEFLAKKKT